MPRRCVLRCPPIPGVPLHIFPSQKNKPERFKAWVQAIGGKLETPDDYEYYKKKRICDLHFPEYSKNRHNRVGHLGVPSLHLTDTNKSPDVDTNQINLNTKNENADVLKECNDLNSHQDNVNNENPPSELLEIINNSHVVNLLNEHQQSNFTVINKRKVLSGIKIFNVNQLNLVKKNQESNLHPLKRKVSPVFENSHQVDLEEHDQICNLLVEKELAIKECAEILHKSPQTIPICKSNVSSLTRSEHKANENQICNSSMIKECKVTLQKLPKVISDNTSNKTSPSTENDYITTIEAPNKIYKVVSINNKIMLVEQNEKELELGNKSDDGLVNNDGLKNDDGSDNCSIYEEYLEDDLFIENSDDDLHRKDEQSVSKNVVENSSLDCKSTKTLNVSDTDRDTDYIKVVDSVEQNANDHEQNCRYEHTEEKNTEITQNMKREIINTFTVDPVNTEKSSQPIIPSNTMRTKVFRRRSYNGIPTKTYRTRPHNSIPTKTFLHKPYNSLELDLSKKKFITKEPFPIFYECSNPFGCNNENVNFISNTQDRLVYKNPYAGVYVAHTQDVRDFKKQNISEADSSTSSSKPQELSRIIEDFVDHFADIMNYEWYNDQDILIYGRHGTAMVLLHEAKYNCIKLKLQEAKRQETKLPAAPKNQKMIEAVENCTKAPKNEISIEAADSCEKPTKYQIMTEALENYKNKGPLELQRALDEVKGLRQELHEFKVKQYLPLKTLYKKLKAEIIKLRRLKQNLYKFYSEAQVAMLTNWSAKKIPWSDDDIKKVIFISHMISPKAYKFLRSQMRFPLPCPKVVENWMKERNIHTNPKTKSKKLKEINVDAYVRNIPKENIPESSLPVQVKYYQDANILTEQMQDGEMTADIQDTETTVVNEASYRGVDTETQQAVEMIIEPQVEEVLNNTGNDQHLAEPVYPNGDLLVTIMDDNNVNEDYYIIDESCVTNDNANDNINVHYVVGEIYPQVTIDVGNNDISDNNIVENCVPLNNNFDNAHYDDGDKQLKRRKSDISNNDNNGDYVNNENYASDGNGDNAHVAGENSAENNINAHNGDNNADENSIQMLARYSKWDLNTLQKFRRPPNCKWEATCQLCRKPFKTKEELKQHLPIHYYNTFYTTYLDVQKPYVCEFCHEELPHKHAVVRHHMKHLGISHFKCWHPGCTYIGTRDGLKSHVYQHMPRRHSCPQCPAAFTSRKSLREHFARRHSARGAHRCQLCGGVYLSEYTYHRHMLSHNKPPRYACKEDGCTERFYCQRALGSHKLTHKESPVYQCPHCPIATFTQPSLLKRHLNRHETCQVAQCARCQKIFSTYSEYYYHLKTDPHIKQRVIYTCACKQTFQYKKNLVLHQKECNCLGNFKNKKRKIKSTIAMDGENKLSDENKIKPMKKSHLLAKMLNVHILDEKVIKPQRIYERKPKATTFAIDQQTLNQINGENSCKDLISEQKLLSTSRKEYVQNQANDQHQNSVQSATNLEQMNLMSYEKSKNDILGQKTDTFIKVTRQEYELIVPASSVEQAALLSNEQNNETVIPEINDIAIPSDGNNQNMTMLQQPCNLQQDTESQIKIFQKLDPIYHGMNRKSNAAEQKVIAISDENYQQLSMPNRASEQNKSTVPMFKFGEGIQTTKIIQQLKGDQAKVIDTMRRLKKLVPVPGAKIKKVISAQNISHLNAIPVNADDQTKGIVTPIKIFAHEIPVPDENNSNKLMPEKKDFAVAKDSCQRTTIIANRAIDKQKRIVAPMIKLEQITPVQNENNEKDIPDPNIVAPIKTIKPKIITVSKKNIFKNLSDTNFTKNMRPVSPVNTNQIFKLTSKEDSKKIHTEDHINKNITKDGDNLRRSALVVKTPEYSQHIYSFEDQKHKENIVLPSVSSQRDMPHID